MDLNGEVRQAAIATDLTPDIDTVSTDAWTRRPFPIQGQGQRNVVQIVIKRSVLNAIRKHGLSRTDVEVCGVLVGNCYRDERGPFVYVEAMVEGEYSDNKVAQVTFTGETWKHIQDVMEQHHSTRRILGWYHTHPNFGIFLSAMDMFIHENFFNQCEQLALVYDPIRGEDGLFVWHKGKAELHPYLVEEDAGSAASPLSRELATAQTSLTAAARFEEGDVPRRLLRLERRHGALEWCVIIAVLFTVAWPFAYSWLELASILPHGAVPNSDPQYAPVGDAPSRSGIDHREHRHSEPLRPETESPKSQQGKDGAGSLSNRPNEARRPTNSDENPSTTNSPRPIDDVSEPREANDSPRTDDGGTEAPGKKGDFDFENLSE